MSFLRTADTRNRKMTAEEIVDRRLADFNQKSEGRRSYCWFIDDFGTSMLVICDKRVHTPDGVKGYISVRHLTFKPKLLGRPFRRPGYSVAHEECFMLHQSRIAMRCFLQRKWSNDPTQAVGTGLSLDAIREQLMVTT